MQIGSTVRLKVPCLGNAEGTAGVCYDYYNLGGHEGYSCIFENGNYDGFGASDEVEQFLEETGFCTEASGYQFKNVIILGNDFQNGVFDRALQSNAGRAQQNC